MYYVLGNTHAKTERENLKKNKEHKFHFWRSWSNWNLFAPTFKKNLGNYMKLWYFSDIGQKLVQDSDPQEKENKQDEPFNFSIYCFVGVCWP